MSNPSCYYPTQVFRFMQPCDFVGLRPTVLSPHTKSPIMVFDSNYAPTPMKCDVLVHDAMQCVICMLMPCSTCTECHMEHINHTIYLVHVYNFQINIHNNVNTFRTHILTFHQTTTNNHAYHTSSNNILSP